jgi:hypothetical protein
MIVIKGYVRFRAGSLLRLVYFFSQKASLGCILPWKTEM